MMISLGPSGTADTGGMTAITARPVQAGSADDETGERAAGGEDPRDGGAGAGRQAEAGDQADREASREVVDAQAIDRSGGEERGRARRNAERLPGPLRRSRRACRLDERRRAATRRRQLLLSRVRRHDEPAHPLQLGPEAGGCRSDDREVHDSPRRHAGQRRGREDERQPAARSGIAAGRARHPTACRRFRISSTDRR